MTAQSRHTQHSLTTFNTGQTRDHNAVPGINQERNTAREKDFEWFSIRQDHLPCLLLLIHFACIHNYEAKLNATESEHNFDQLYHCNCNV